jgi:cell pole-organizing protein PopZ
MMPKIRPVIYGKPSLKASPAYDSPVDTPEAQAAAMAEAAARVRATEAANLRGETRPDERYPARD